MIGNLFVLLYFLLYCFKYNLSIIYPVSHFKESNCTSIRKAVFELYFFFIIDQKVLLIV